MSEEEVIEITEEPEESELSDIEQEAVNLGWVADGVEGKRNLSAEEFVDRQRLYEDIRGLKKQNRKLQDGLTAMKDFQATIRSNERERVIAELNTAKKTALEQEDYNAVVAIDDKIAKQRVPEVPQSNEAFESWIDDNDWYHQNDEMKQYADMIGTGYFQQNPRKDMNDVYKYVTEEVKKRFPDSFENRERSKPNSVEGAGKGRAKTSKRHSAKDLPEDARQIMKTIVRTGTMTEAEYLASYFD